MKLTLKKYQSINEIQAECWDSLNKDQNPFIQHRFLAALENSGAVSQQTGWDIAHIGWLDGEEKLIAALPQYYKSHSYGEYMFDWNWANGISQAGIAYYPKSISAIPFSPVTGPRLMIAEELNSSELRSKLVKQFIDSKESQQFSNIQCLYITESEAKDWLNAGAMMREGHQYSWYNDHYKNFDDFLSKLSSSPRKKIRRERRILSDKGVTFECLVADEITDPSWDFFIQCYQQTYLKRSGHMGYLSADFFHRLRRAMSEQLVIINAHYLNNPVASSLFIKGNNVLYGRYWGAMEVINGLHFECCYYQAIDYCIKEAIGCLQPGTQGDYKRRRGFVPEKTYGAYHFNLTNLRQPIQSYLNDETEQLNRQFEEWKTSTPYKSTAS